MSKKNFIRNSCFTFSFLACVGAQAVFDCPSVETVRKGLIANIDDFAANKNVRMKLACEDGKERTFESNAPVQYQTLTPEERAELRAKLNTAREYLWRFFNSPFVINKLPSSSKVEGFTCEGKEFTIYLELAIGDKTIELEKTFVIGDKKIGDKKIGDKRQNG